MCAIHCTDANDNFSALKSLLTWEEMLKAVKIRSYVPILNLVISELNGYPVGVKYHRTVRNALHINYICKRLSKKSANTATR